MSLVLVILLILLLFGGIGAAPAWGHSWGWGPSSILWVLFVVFLVLILTDRVHL